MKPILFSVLFAICASPARFFDRRSSNERYDPDCVGNVATLARGRSTNECRGYSTGCRYGSALPKPLSPRYGTSTRWAVAR